MNNYAYITLLTDNPSYINGVLLLRESLVRVKSKYPLYVGITEDVPDEIKNILKQADIKTIVLDKLETPANIYEHNKKADPMRADIWKYTLTKFGIFSLTQFDKVIYCDSDLMFYKNVDHCFEMPHMTAALDGEYFNLWPNWSHFNSGFVVIKPEKDLKDKLLDFTKSLSNKQIENYRGGNTIIADQDLLNMYYNKWPEQKELHLDKWYNVFNVHVHHSDCTNIINNAYFVHFVGSKPWESGWINGLDNSAVHTYYLTGIESCIIASTIIQLSYLNNLKPLNWDMLNNLGEFEYAIANNAFTNYRKYDIALTYIDKALSKSKAPKYLNLKNQIETMLKAADLQPIIRSIYDRLYMEAIKDGECSFPYYFVDQTYGPISNKDSVESAALTLDTWGTIKKAIYRMMKDRYKF